MGIPYREELVGKRFLVVSGLVKPKISKITEWKWRAGVIRAVDKSSKGKDAIVYVEVDSLDWQKRDWLKVQDPSHQAFLVEKGLVWGERIDPYTDKPNTVLWPALSFEVLVDRIGIASAPVRPLEFLVDQHLSFVKNKEIQPFKEEDVETVSHPIYERYPDVRDETHKWLHEQKEQFVLMQGPYQLTGIRVKVYRLGSTTQWFTAVITCHDLLSRELVVMDDTVLETHTQNPAHVQMMFLDDVVNSLLKGENVGITRRNNRATANNPAVTTQATSTTHSRPVPRSQSPSHAPTSQPSTISSSSSSSSSTSTISNKKKRSKDKDVTRVPTPPAPELPEKSDKTALVSPADKPVKEKAATSCSGHKSKKERKRKSGEQAEEEKKSASPSPGKRPRSNSGSSVSSHERSEATPEATSLTSEFHGEEEARNTTGSSKSEKDSKSQDATTVAKIPVTPQESAETSSNGKTRNKFLTRQEQTLSESKDSRSSTPDSVKRSKHRSKKESKDKVKPQDCVETAAVAAVEAPPCSQSKENIPVSSSGCKPMVELKSETTPASGVLSNAPSKKEPGRKLLPEQFAGWENNRAVLHEQSLTSAIAGIIARELNRDLSPNSPQASKRSEPSSSVSSTIPSSIEQQTSLSGQKPRSVSCASTTNSIDSFRPLHSGPSTVLSSSSTQSPLPHRTVATSHGNGTVTGLTGMDKNAPSHILKENPRLPSATHLPGKTFSEHPILGERIERPEVKDFSRETSSVASDRSESIKSISSERSKDSEQIRLEKKSSLVTDLSRPVEVYRDPNLSDSEVIHVNSIQHHPAHLMKIGDHHTPSPGHNPVTPSPHSIRNTSVPASVSAGAPATPSAIAASPSAFVAAPPPVGHIPAHHPAVAQHAMFPATHLQLYQQHQLASQLAVAGHFPQHPLASLESHSLQHQLHAQHIMGLVQQDPLGRIRMGSMHGMMSPQHQQAATAMQVHPGITPAQLQALQQQHPGLPLAPSWVLPHHEELERAHLQQQREQQQKSAAEKTPPALPHHTSPSSQHDLKARLDPSPGGADKKLHPAAGLHGHPGGPGGPGGHHPGVTHPGMTHPGHPAHLSVSQAAVQGLMAAHESGNARDAAAAAAAAAAHHNAAVRQQQFQELDAQAAVQQHFQESLRKLQVQFSFTTPTTGGSITEGTALPKTKGQLPKEMMDRQQRDRAEHEERLRREREEKELEWQRIQMEKERKMKELDPRLRYPAGDAESAYKHAVSEGQRQMEEQAYRQALGQRYQEELAASKYHMERKPEAKIKLERTEIGARAHDGQGFKAYPSIRTDSHTMYYKTMALKEEPRAGVPVRTEHNRQMASSAFKAKPDNLVGYQPFAHTMSSGHGGEKGVAEAYSSHAEEYKVAANAAAKQGARKGIPTPPPLIKREPEGRGEASMHGGVIQASRSERRPDVMHHPMSGVFTSASISGHDIHPSQAGGHHLVLSDMKQTNSDGSHSSVIKHTIGTPPPLHSSAHTAQASQQGRPGMQHIPPQSPLKVATPQQLSAAVLQLGSHAVSSSTTSTVGMYPHHMYSSTQTTPATSNSSLLMSALRPADGARVSEAMEVDPSATKRKSGQGTAIVHKKRPKTKEEPTGQSDKKAPPTGTSYIEQYQNFVNEPNPPPSSVGSATVGKAGENIELKIEKVDQYRRLNLDSSAPASLMSAEVSRTTNGTLSDSDSNRCVSPRSTASDSSDGRSLKSASPHRAGGPVYLKKAWLARHSESRAPMSGHSSVVTQSHPGDTKQENGGNTKLSSSLPNGHLMSSSFAQISQSVDADKSVTIDDIPKSIPNHVYDFDHDKSSTCSETSTTSSHKSRSRKSKDSSRKKKERKHHGSTADSKSQTKDKGDKAEDKRDDVDKHKSEYLLGLEACRQLPNNGESKSTQQITELLNMIASQTPKKRKVTRASKDSKDGQLNVSRALVKPTVAKLKKSGEAFLQDGMCCEITPNLMKCRECRIKPSAKQSKLNIFCRFYAFRRLKYSNKGNLTIAGFSEPEHCDAEDLNPWLPYPPEAEASLDLETCLYIISRVGPQFCQLVQQEQEAKNWCTNPGKIAWKRAVTGVREMCDTCDTTLFNIHWTCSKCGFVVCLDCYRARSKEEKTLPASEEETPEGKGSSKWLKCIKDQPHQPDGLMLTQIIPGNALWDVGALVHQVCTKWNIQSACPCLSDGRPVVNGTSPTSSQTSPDWRREDLLSTMALSGHITNSRQSRMPKLTSLPPTTSALDFLADIATSQDGKRGIDPNSLDKACLVDGATNAKGEPCSTLRDLLMKTAGKHKSTAADGNILSAFLPKVDGNSRKTSRTMTSTFEDIIATVVEQNIAAPGKDRSGMRTPRLSTTSGLTDISSSIQSHGRLDKKVWNLASKNTLVESSVKFPDVPHSWLCDGRLLRLHDPSHPRNMEIWQEQWRKGEPILVSNVHKQLDETLWHPDFFNKQFGHIENDLVDCQSGDVITGAPMRDFWNGFEDISNRLETKEGLPIIMKLKDWPPAEDFSELMPQHFQDLMSNLPLPDYTRRDGRLNLSARLPDFFVKPDLGPKMYNAYGVARYPSTGTTNLHLDISDAVNVMVYVGMPKSGDDTCNSYEQEALDAVDHACPDEQTRKRVREDKERPGAIWHLFRAQDTNKIRQFLVKLSKEQGEDVPSDHDPIHDQSWYLDNPMLDRLYKEYGVLGWAITQCWGDAIFIPAGAPHQVRNMHSSIKVAEDFVSPEHISECFWLTQEFRKLSATHTNHEDKLQVKNIIYHAIKDTIGLLMTKTPPGAEKTTTNSLPLPQAALQPQKEQHQLQSVVGVGGGMQPSQTPPPQPTNQQTPVSQPQPPLAAPTAALLPPKRPSSSPASTAVPVVASSNVCNSS